MADYIETAIRSLLLIFSLFIITKLLGKKQLAEMNIFEYTSGIVLGSIAAMLSLDLDLNLSNGLVTLFIWFIVPYIVEWISLQSRSFRKLVNGTSTILIEDGKVIEKNLRKETLTLDELLANLRTKNILKVEDVEFATLETSGKLSIIPKKVHQPLTAYDLNLQLQKSKKSETVIIDGQLMLNILKKRQLSIEWLNKKLKKKNIKIEDIFLAQLDATNKLTCHLYKEKL